MKTQTQTLILITLISFIALNGMFAAPLGRTGGWKPIKDIKNPHVKEIGQYAVSQHNKDVKANLKFIQVVRGETQVISGENYRLIILAKDGAAKNNYEAVVWEKAWQGYMNLTSFKQV
ncbi:hypothetical protein GIB67_013374 [Kingdonia uniflora]|uniref:Cystatin domain-containing protein n=1 Tax=Kingdonia uniflora TaxID=39325 RepID=A0A7J7LQU8_9MAGN|nr:hypothetical protein GIB67_013374 [Kingdonia uniflora]